jgi:hypothetical protein
VLVTEVEVGKPKISIRKSRSSSRKSFLGVKNSAAALAVARNSGGTFKIRRCLQVAVEVGAGLRSGNDLTAALRDKLVSIGLLNPERVAVAKPLAEPLADFAAALSAKGNTVFHVETVTGQARRLFEGCGASCLALSSGSEGPQGDYRGLASDVALQCSDPGKDAVSAANPGSGSVCTSGEGPGLQNQCMSPLSSAGNPESARRSALLSENPPDDLASCLALLARKSANLALVAERWDSLPDAVRSAIITLVKASSK